MKSSGNIFFTAHIIGGCNPFNWLSQTRRSLTIKYLNLNFVFTPKLTPLHSIHFMQFSFGWLLVLVWLLRLASAYTSKPFRYRYFAVYPFRFKVFNQIGTRWYFQLVENKNCFAWETAKEVAEGLGTSPFVTVTNLWGNSSGNIFSNNLLCLTVNSKFHYIEQTHMFLLYSSPKNIKWKQERWIRTCIKFCFEISKKSI